MASLYKKPVIRTDPATGQKIKAKSKKWWGQYKDALGRLRRVPLAIDKVAAQAMLNQIVQRVEREKAGLVDPTEEERRRPLVEHVADFQRSLVHHCMPTSTASGTCSSRTWSGRGCRPRWPRPWPGTATFA